MQAHAGARGAQINCCWQTRRLRLLQWAKRILHCHPSKRTCCGARHGGVCGHCELHLGRFVLLVGEGGWLQQATRM
jgi:hypothetical protein